MSSDFSVPILLAASGYLTLLISEMIIFKMITASKLTRFIILPGIIFHELSHLMMCYLTLRKVDKVVLYTYSAQNGIDGSVSFYSKHTLLHWIGDMLVGIAPILTSSVVFVSIFVGLDIPPISLFESSFIENTLPVIFSIWVELDAWIILILFSISWSALPSKEDLKVARKGLILVALVFIFVVYVYGIDWLLPLRAYIEILATSFLIITIPSVILLIFLSAVIAILSNTFALRKFLRGP